MPMATTPNWATATPPDLRINVWQGHAEHLADSPSKGDRVMVTGRRRQLR